MAFRVIDRKTGKEADPSEIARKESWAQNLIGSDMEEFFLGEYGALILADECGNYVFCDGERFEVQAQ